MTAADEWSHATAFKDVTFIFEITSYMYMKYQVLQTLIHTYVLYAQWYFCPTNYLTICSEIVHNTVKRAGGIVRLVLKGPLINTSTEAQNS